VHFENDIQPAARSLFGVNARSDLVEKAERKNCLKIACNLGFAVGVAGTRLNVIKDIVLAETAIALNVDVFNYTSKNL